MGNTRYKDADWQIKANADGSVPQTDAHLAVFMDLRDELKRIRYSVEQLNASIACRNFQRVPLKLDRIGLAASKILAHLKGDQK